MGTIACKGLREENKLEIIYKVMYLSAILPFGIPCNFLVIVRNEVPGKRSCCEQNFGNVVWLKGEAFHSHVIRSQDFSDPILWNYEVHSCFSPFRL